MDEDRWAAKRLLSFDSASNSWTRFGKVFSQRAGQSPAENAPDWVAEDRTGHHKAPGPIVAMASSSDRRLAATIGSSWMEVVEVQPGSAETVASLKLDAKFKPTTLEWGQLSTRNSVAVASSTGGIHLFAFNGQSIIASRSTTGASIQPSISSLNFSSMANGNILAASSNDGNVKLWDLRQGLKRAASKFARNGDIARQVQFRPEDETRFATIYDSGMLQLWDIRKPSSCDTRINAHMQGLTLDWHPTANYLATGGRDHFVQVWNLGIESKTPEYTVNTASAVGRVKWMPGDSSVASNAIITAGRSAAASNKRSTSYWLLKQPWAPIYALETHTDSIVDIAPVSPMVFWSASQDGLLLQHDLRFEPLVHDNFPPAVATWSSSYCVTVASRERVDPSEEALRDCTPDSEDEVPAAPMQTHKSAASLSIFGSSFGVGSSGSHTDRLGSISERHGSISDHRDRFNSISGDRPPHPSPVPSGSATPIGSAGHSYFGSFGSSLGTASIQGPMARPEQNLAAMLCRITAASKPSPVFELDLMASDLNVRENVGAHYHFSVPPGLTMGDTCRLNSAAGLTALDTTNLWLILGVAIDETQKSYIDSLSGRSREIAELWLSGGDVSSLVEDAPKGGGTLGTVSTSDISPADTKDANDTTTNNDAYTWAITNNTWNSGVSFTSDLSHSEDDHPPARQSGNGRRPSTLFHNRSSTHGHVPQLKASSHLNEVRRGFIEFVKSRNQTWHFLPMLKLFVQQTIEDGIIYTATALLMVFHMFEGVLDMPESEEVVVAAIQNLRMRHKFAAAASVLNMSDIWQRHMGKPATQVDVACQQCRCSLSENTAFFVTDNSTTGYWYCARCKTMQGFCSYCNIPVKGLGIVVLECGHKAHHKCWQEWLQMKIMSCPAGCGQDL